MISRQYFEIFALKPRENIHENMQFPFNEIERHQSTAYSWTANLHYRYFSESAQKGKDALKSRKFQNTFAKLSLLF